MPFLWLKHSERPELHQPSMLPGKYAFLAFLGVNLQFLASAAADLPHFLVPRSEDTAVRPLLRHVSGERVGRR